MKYLLCLLPLLLAACTAQIQRVTTAEQQADELMVNFDHWAAQHETELATAPTTKAARHAALKLFREHKGAMASPTLVLGADLAIDRALACIEAVGAQRPGADVVAQTCTSDLRQALTAFEVQESVPVVPPQAGVRLATPDGGVR
jgi:hypothetical protein